MDTKQMFPVSARWGSLAQRTRLLLNFAITSALVIIISLVLFVVNVAANGASITKALQSGTQGKPGIRFLGHIYNIDVDARQADISWELIGCGNEFALAQTVGIYGTQDCGILGKSVDIYVDGSQQPLSFDPSLRPLAGNRYIGVQAIDRIETTHLLSINGFSFRPNWSFGDQQSAFPFDRYDLETTFLVMAHNTSTPLPILSLIALDSTQNFLPHLSFDLDVQVNVNGTMVPARSTHSRFGRTALTQSFVIIIFAVNWLLTALVLFITLQADSNTDSSIMLLPVTVILTIPALRALWIGGPAFGLILDSCGLFPQMVVVSICSMFLVLYAGMKPKKEQPDNNGQKTDHEPHPRLESVHVLSDSDPAREKPKKGEKPDNKTDRRNDQELHPLLESVTVLSASNPTATEIENVERRKSD